MRVIFIAGILLSLINSPSRASNFPSLETAPRSYITPSPSETGKRIVANVVGRRFGWRYQKVCTYYGCLMLADATGDKSITDQIIKGYSPFLSGKRKPHTGHVDYNVFGIWPFEMYRQTGLEKFLAIPKKLADNEFAKLQADGLTFLTRFWVDDMYMVGSLQTQAYKSLKDTVYLNRAARQLVVYCNRLQKDNGLFYHRKDAPFFWGRGNGWAAAAMTEVLLVLPQDNKFYQSLLNAYHKMMKTLLSFQGEDGMWHQLLDEPKSYPESSCTGMFIYALATGLDKGWLPANEYSSNVSKGWKALAGYVSQKGEVMNVCVGTNAKNNKKHYLTRPKSTGNFHGQAAVLWAATAMIRLEGKIEKKNSLNIAQMEKNILLSNNITGLQHIGIPVTNLLKSVAFYERFGFERVMSAKVPQDNNPPIQVGMMKLGDVIVELYQLTGQEWKELTTRSDGHIDHVAFNVKDIDAAFREINQAGIPTIEKAPVFLDFWGKGCKYFAVRGPDGEKLEFNQIL